MEVSGQLDVPAALPQVKWPPVPNGHENRWAPEPIWMLWTRKISLPLPGTEPRFVDRLVRSLAASLRITEDFVQSCAALFWGL
jgi:hypothetical protein